MNGRIDPEELPKPKYPDAFISPQEQETSEIEITEITYSVGRTIQIKQYEPINIHYSAKATVKGDTMKAYDQLAKIVNKRIGAEELKWNDPQMAVRALMKEGKTELARQMSKEKEKLPF